MIRKDWMNKMTVYLRYRTEGQERRAQDQENEDYVLSITSGEGRTRVLFRAKKELTLISASIKEAYPYRSDCRIMVNGYQSWTDAREYDMAEELHNMNRVPKWLKKKFHFESYGDDWFMRYEKGRLHSFTYSYIRNPEGTGDFIGSFNESHAYLIIRHDKTEQELSLESDCQHKKLRAGEEFCLYDYIRSSGPVFSLTRDYFARLGSCKAPAIRGYTSWYQHYQNINEDKLEKALEGISPEDFDLFQIDDGFETFVGDWLEIDPEKFPNGLSPLIEKIHGKGLKAGIWMAPFVCEVKSRLFREHPDWIYREEGKEVFAGCNWSGDVVLDICKKEVQDYIRRCLEYYMDAGFDFFKLDFLYAAAMVHKSSGKTRAEIMRGAMEWLREILEDKLILGCGVPLSSAFHLVDYCRVGPDVSLKFDDVFYMRPMHRERISTKTTLQNTIYRSLMDGHVFRCDPDVYLLREDHISLSAAQREALVMLNHLCGAVSMTSDDVGNYDGEKRKILAEARALSRAEIFDIRQEKDRISVSYSLDGEDRQLSYDREKGVLRP